MAKVNNYPNLPWYYYSTYPKPVTKVVNRRQRIKDGASTKGSDIGFLDVGDVVLLDTSEYWDGWIRIMKVDGYNPAPSYLMTALSGKLPQDKELWIDVSGVSDIVEPEPLPEPTPAVVRKWKITATIEEIVE